MKIAPDQLKSYLTSAKLHILAEANKKVLFKNLG